MGSYAESWVNDFYIGSSKNDIDPEIMKLFRESDRQTVSVNNGGLPKRLSRAEQYLEEEEEVNVVFYSISVKELRDRLDLIGYSLDNAKQAFKYYLESEISRYEQWNEDEEPNGSRSYGQKEVDILREMSTEKWISNLDLIYKAGKSKFEIDEDAVKDDELLSYMLKNDWYGYSGAEFNIPLRIVLEIIPDDENFIYDVTELILSGYLNEDDDLVECAINRASSEYYHRGKCIILTEGKYDTFVLSESLQLLYPHLSDYFTFMDFNGARVGGGAGSLANMVKSFSGAGLVNKVVAVFDNDTAARDALRGLDKANIAKNIKVFTLPRIDLLDDYPTIGPTGMVSMNVNSLAGSIEPYLGKDCLSPDGVNYYPVKWTGLVAGLQQYQGEIMEKEQIQSNFEDKLNNCKKTPSLINEYDWSSIKLILESVFKLFHEDDGKKILAVMDEYI